MDNPIKLNAIESTPPLANLDRLCDMQEGRMAGKIFWDSEIYEQELEKIFARCWLFVAHESQIPKAGDYVATTLGEDEVLVVRQKDQSIKVLINACPHRGNKVCFAEAGNARGFICNYHGWAFGPDGALRGMHESG
ncbi:Rieske [2Fe-2S] domain-containing protein, partial [Azotobacter beijerinckii]